MSGLIILLLGGEKRKGHIGGLVWSRESQQTRLVNEIVVAEARERCHYHYHVLIILARQETFLN